MNLRVKYYRCECMCVCVLNAIFSLNIALSGVARVWSHRMAVISNYSCTRDREHQVHTHTFRKKKEMQMMNAPIQKSIKMI